MSQDKNKLMNMLSLNHYNNHSNVLASRAVRQIHNRPESLHSHKCSSPHRESKESKLEKRRHGDPDQKLTTCQQREKFEKAMEELENEFMQNQAKNMKYVKTKKVAEKAIRPIIRKIDPDAVLQEQSDNISEGKLQVVVKEEIGDEENSDCSFDKSVNTKRRERLEEELQYAEIMTKKDRNKFSDECMSILRKSKFRKWLKHTGREQCIDFKDEELRKLRECFDALDDDHGNSIGLEELEEPLIGLGLANTKEEVDEIIRAVDEDGVIEFKEFLDIIKSNDQSEKTALIKKFFKQLAKGELGDPNLSFNMNVQNIRRETMKEAIIGTGQTQLDGMKVLNNVEVQLRENGKIPTKIKSDRQNLTQSPYK